MAPHSSRVLSATSPGRAKEREPRLRLTLVLVSSSAWGPVQLLPTEELQRSPVFLLRHPHHSCPGPVHDRWDEGEPALGGYLLGGPSTRDSSLGMAREKGSKVSWRPHL